MNDAPRRNAGRAQGLGAFMRIDTGVGSIEVGHIAMSPLLQRSPAATEAIVYKGRSRDTAWYSIIDMEWPRVRESFERWLDPGNSDAAGRQRRALAELRRRPDAEP